MENKDYNPKARDETRSKNSKKTPRKLSDVLRHYLGPKDSTWDSSEEQQEGESLQDHSKKYGFPGPTVSAWFNSKNDGAQKPLARSSKVVRSEGGEPQDHDRSPVSSTREQSVTKDSTSKTDKSDKSSVGLKTEQTFFTIPDWLLRITSLTPNKTEYGTSSQNKVEGKNEEPKTSNTSKSGVGHDQKIAKQLSPLTSSDNVDEKIATRTKNSVESSRENKSVKQDVKVNKAEGKDVYSNPLTGPGNEKWNWFFPQTSSPDTTDLAEKATEKGIGDVKKPAADTIDKDVKRADEAESKWHWFKHNFLKKYPDHGTTKPSVPVLDEEPKTRTEKRHTVSTITELPKSKPDRATAKSTAPGSDNKPASEEGKSLKPFTSSAKDHPMSEPGPSTTKSGSLQSDKKQNIREEKQGKHDSSTASTISRWHWLKHSVPKSEPDSRRTKSTAPGPIKKSKEEKDELDGSAFERWGWIRRHSTNKTEHKPVQDSSGEKDKQQKSRDTKKDRKHSNS